MPNLLRSPSPILLAAAALPLILGFLLTPTAAARPCKTLFITFTVEPIRVLHPQTNPNTFIFSDPQNPNANYQFVPESIRIVDRRPNSISFDHRRKFLPRLQMEAEKPQQPPTFLGLFPLPTEGIDFGSLFDRTKDVMSVVVALLFGVGCGALTAATMYFSWTLFVGRGADDEEEELCDSEYDDIPSPKKGGYVKVPEAVEVAAAPVKEMV